MPVSKIKNIVIAVLLLANLVFLMIVLSDAAADRRAERETRENLISLFDASGIKLTAEDITSDTEAATFSTERSVEAEKRIADRLLGNTESEERGGNVYTYTGERGTAVFRTGAEFSAEITGGALRAGGDPADYAVRLLQEAGVSAAARSVSETPDGALVRVVCTHDRMEIFNCTIDITFDGELRLSGMSGRVFCAPDAREGDSAVTSAATALMGFLSAVRSGEASCTEVTDVVLGYAMSSTPFGDGELSPVWRIVTDGGDYYVDVGTGELLTGMS